MYGNNEHVPRKLMDIFVLGSPGIKNHTIRQVGATDPDSLIEPSLTNRNLSSTIV